MIRPWISAMTAVAADTPARNSRAPLNEPVDWRTQPMMAGPKNPPRLPTELINASPAAAVRVSSVVGKIQMFGVAPPMPAAPTTRPIRLITGESVKAAAAKPAALIRNGAATCQTRSRVRSACRPETIIAIAMASAGIAATNPVCTTLSPNARTICGIQIAVPVVPMTRPTAIRHISSTR